MSITKQAREIHAMTLSGPIAIVDERVWKAALDVVDAAELQKQKCIAMRAAIAAFRKMTGGDDE